MNTSTPIGIHDQVPQISLIEVFDRLDATAKNLRHIKRKTFTEAGLTPPQYAILRKLWENDRQPFKDLADALLCTRATITGLIDSLESKGLVVREINPADRRSFLAALTERGRNLEHNTPSLENLYNTCCSGLSPLEFQQLGFLLYKLNNSLIYPEVE